MWNSRIPYYVILGLDPRIFIWNSRILCDEIPRSSRGMTQDLEILDFALGILDFHLKFPTMSSPSLTGGSLYGILEFLNDINSKSP